MLKRLRETTFKDFIPVKEVSVPKLPSGHLAAMEVPQGGSSCAKCEYLGKDKKTCTEKNFIAWDGPNKPAGSNKLPLPADRYCSDWFDWSGRKK